MQNNEKIGGFSTFPVNPDRTTESPWGASTLAPSPQPSKSEVAAEVDKKNADIERKGK